MNQDKIIRFLKSSFYLFMGLLVIGMISSLSHYPYAKMIGTTGLIGLVFSKFIPFYIDFSEKKWRLTLINYADVALWLWVIVKGFRILHVKMLRPYSYYLKTLDSALLVIAISLFVAVGIKWFYNRSKHS